MYKNNELTSLETIKNLYKLMNIIYIKYKYDKISR